MIRYTITLRSGRQLQDLEKNGSMFVSKTEITKDDLTQAELERVTITETDETDEYPPTVMTNAVCDTVLEWPEGWLFNIREKTEMEKIREENAMLTECILEMSEEIYGE